MYTLNCRGKLLTIDEPLVMGIINLTTDSFYSGSRVNDVNSVALTVKQMIDDGASFIDIGGQSTRPGSMRISAEEEAARVLPAIERILDVLPQTIVSIDTYHADVARQAVNAGASMINDIGGAGLIMTC